jgi:hypothetical protein
MLKLLRPFALLLMLAPAGPASAQSADAIAAAKELMVVMHTEDGVRSMMPSIVRIVKAAVVQDRMEIAPDFDTLMLSLVRTVSVRPDQIVDEIAAIYARRFTAAEMREVAQFYRSPTGQKLVQQMPDIVQQSGTIAQQFSKQIATELQQRMTEELRKKGHKL